MPNIQLQDTLPRVSAKVRELRMYLADHCVRHPQQTMCPRCSGNPSIGQDHLKKDKAHRKQETSDPRTLMLDMDVLIATIKGF